jgi:ketosteroid isomerase-like protein
MNEQGRTMDRLGDRIAIHDLTGKYAFYADTFKLDPLMALWTEDGVFDELQTGAGRHEGYDNIRKFFAHINATLSHMAHHVTNQFVVSFDGDIAKGHCFSLVEGVVRGGGTLQGSVYYEDEYRCEDGIWRFRSRTVVPLMPLRNEAFTQTQ